MSAGKYNIEIESGSEFVLQLNWGDADNNPINLIGYNAFAQIRNRAGGDILVDISSDEGDIQLSENGQIDIEIPGEKTQGIEGNGLWDLLLISPTGERTRLVEGKVVLDRGITEV